MAQAIVDPAELRRFARSLKKFNGDLRDQVTLLAGQLSALSETWRDQEQKKFTEQFEQHMKAISRLAEITDEHIPYLLRKAEHIEEYLQSN